ncbi:hypothetical protein Q5H92_00960 [Hymenobacter sp. M29]|uniref:Roadblock/LAMTOR2 domain-containing protein n=1 Tax=Hymenobacter mellowenesis TaxID=3063995 RepID=A0ABT9A6C5_9BACT|nr:hypothetical protein [Hymenobacter sp. M29]MDO7844909.1 hypothetical protein [Hymenobacter sp. M29]
MSVAADVPLRKRIGSARIIEGSQAIAASEINLSKIQKVINRALVDLPALTTIAVVEVTTANCLAHFSRSRGFDPVATAAHHAETVRQQQQALATLPKRGERLEDILIPLRKQLHLIRLSKNGQWFVYLAVKAQDTSLALAREVLKSIIF